MSGKGSKPRPYSVSKAQFNENFERIFGKKESAESEKPTDKQDEKAEKDEDKYQD